MRVFQEGTVQSKMARDAANTAAAGAERLCRQRRRCGRERPHDSYGKEDVTMKNIQNLSNKMQLASGVSMSMGRDMSVEEFAVLRELENSQN